jgi:kynurenine formamidase
LLRRDVEGYYSQGWTIQEHSGTHVDMPSHFYEGGRTAPELRPDELILAAVVIRIGARAAHEPDCVLSLDDVRSFEREHGRIPRHAAALMDSGWHTRVTDPARFINAQADGTFAFPGFDADAVRFLVQERGVACIGVDTLSLDRGSSTTYPSHQAVLSADRFGIEALANLDTIPPRGATLTIGPIHSRTARAAPATCSPAGERTAAIVAGTDSSPRSPRASAGAVVLAQRAKEHRPQPLLDARSRPAQGPS